MQELSIEGPRMRYPGQKQSFPVYLQNVPHVQVPGYGHSGHPDQPGGMVHNEEEDQRDPPFVAPAGNDDNQTPRPRTSSILKTGGRPRGESVSQMARRVDFSLGAKSAARGNMAGDVYEDRSRSRVPIEVQEASRSRERERETSELRASLERSLRDSQEAARTTSRDDRLGPGNLNRRSTDSGSRWRNGPVHRNRFFGRTTRGNDEQVLMENGMADIPEDPSGSQFPSNERLDPRTGMISPQAYRTTTDEGNMHPPQIQPGRGSYDIANMSIRPEGHRPVGRSQTEDFEMRRMH